MSHQRRIALAMSAFVLVIGAVAGWLYLERKRRVMEHPVRRWFASSLGPEFLAAVDCSLSERLAGCRELPKPTGPLAPAVDSLFATIDGSVGSMKCQAMRQGGIRRWLPAPNFSCSAKVADTSLSVQIRPSGHVYAFDLRIRTDSSSDLFSRLERDYHRRYATPGPCFVSYALAYGRQARSWRASRVGAISSHLSLMTDRGIGTPPGRQMVRRVEAVQSSRAECPAQ